MPCPTWPSSPCPATIGGRVRRAMWRLRGADRRDRVSAGFADRRCRQDRGRRTRSWPPPGATACASSGRTASVSSRHEPDSTPRSPTGRSVPAGIAIASQSGGVGVAIAAEAEDRCAGISSFVSMGNKVDVSGNDLLRLWADDASTTVVLLYLESFGDPVRFARVARAVSQRKPVVALKSGRSALGRQTRRVTHRRPRQRPGDGRRPVRPHRRAAGQHAGGADRRRTAPRPPAGPGRAAGRPRSATSAGH